MRWIKRLMAYGTLAGFVCALVYAFLPQPTPVDVAFVSQGPLQVFVEEDGKTRLRDRYTVSAPLAGRLLRIAYRAGDVVYPGEAVATIEPGDPDLLDPRELAEIEARVKSAEAAVERSGTAVDAARAAVDLAEAEFERSTELFRKNALAKTDLDLKVMQKRTRTAEYGTAVHSREVARSDLKLAQAALVRTRPAAGNVDMKGEPLHFEIPAPPLSGSGRRFHVLRVFRDSAGVVTPGTPLLELGDPSDLEIEIDVLSSDAVRVRPGARVLLEQWGGDEALEARVRLVEPSGFTKFSALGVEEQRVNVIAEFSGPDRIPPTLGDAYRVEAKIIVWEKEDVLRVRTSALFRHGDGWAVFRVEEGKTRLARVGIGRRNGLDAEVLEGLAKGDTVVVHPSDKVIDGGLVRTR